MPGACIETVLLRAAHRVGAAHQTVEVVVGKRCGAAEVVDLGLQVAHLVVGVAVGEGREQCGFLGWRELGNAFAARRCALGNRVAQFLAQALVHRAIACHECVAHTVGLGEQLIELVVDVAADGGRLRGARAPDLHAGRVVVAVVGKRGDDAVGIGQARDTVHRIEGIERALAVLVDRLDLVAVAVEAVLYGVTHRALQPGGKIDDRSARNRIEHAHRRRHLEAQTVVPVVLHPRDAARSVRHLRHIAGGVIGVGGEVAFGIRDTDQLVLGVVGIGRGLALRDLELQTGNHRQQVLVLVVAVLRDLAVGHRLQAQQPVAVVLVTGGVAPRIGLGDQVAFEVIGQRARVLHRRCRGIPVVIHRRARDPHELAPHVVGVGRLAALGIRHAGAVADVVIAHRGGACARGVAVQRRIDGRDQPVVAIEDLRDRVAVPVRGEPDPVAHRVVGEKRLAPGGVLQLYQAVVGIVGIPRQVAAGVRAREHVAEVVIRGGIAEPLGIDRPGVVAERIVEVARELLLVGRHISGLFGAVGPVQIDHPGRQVAEAVVGEARDVPARIDLLDQVLLGVIAERGDTAVRQGDRGDLVERRVAVGGGVAEVVGAREQVAPRVVGVARGEQRPERRLVGIREIGNQLAQARRAADIAKLRPQPPVIHGVAVCHREAIAIRHREQVASRIVGVGRCRARLTGHLRDRAVCTVGEAHRVAERICHGRRALPRANAAAAQHKGVAEQSGFALGIDDLRQHARARRRHARAGQCQVLETDHARGITLRHCTDRLRRRQFDALQVPVGVIEVAGDMPHAVCHRGQTTIGEGVTDQHNAGLVRHTDQTATRVVGITQHMALVICHLRESPAAVIGVGLEHPVGVFHPRQAPLGAEAERRLVVAHHLVAHGGARAVTQHLEGLIRARPVGGDVLARRRVQHVLIDRVVAVAHLVARTRTRAHRRDRHVRRIAPARIVEGAARGADATRVVGAHQRVVLAKARQVDILMRVEQVAARHVDEHLIAVVRACRAGLVVAAKDRIRTVEQTGGRAADENGHREPSGNL